MTALTLDHIDIISRCSLSLKALASLVDDPNDAKTAGLASILERVYQDLDRVSDEGGAALRAEVSAD